MYASFLLDHERDAPNHILSRRVGEGGSIGGCCRKAILVRAVQRELGEGCECLDTGKDAEARYKAFSLCRPTTFSRKLSFVGRSSTSEKDQNGAVHSPFQPVIN